MKHILLPILLVCALSSCNKTIKRSAIVIKDCTGSYVKRNNADYLICNNEVVANIEHGTEVYITYKNIKGFKNSDEVACDMYHKTKGIIELIKIEKK